MTEEVKAAKRHKPYTLRLSMDEDEECALSAELMDIAGSSVRALMQRTIRYGGRVTLECDARNVLVQWTPPTGDTK
jgi:hypothetical protein